MQLRSKLPTLRAVKLVGGATPAAAGTPVTLAQPDAAVFVTDVDLFAPGTEAVLADASAPLKGALVSVRRLRESFYRRKVDPQLQYAVGLFPEAQALLETSRQLSSKRASQR